MDDQDRGRTFSRTAHEGFPCTAGILLQDSGNGPVRRDDAAFLNGDFGSGGSG